MRIPQPNLAERLDDHSTLTAQPGGEKRIQVCIEPERHADSRHPAPRERAANSSDARMSSNSKSGNCVSTCSGVRPCASNPRTSATRMRIPRTHGLPPHWPGRIVIRVRRLGIGASLTAEPFLDRTSPTPAIAHLTKRRRRRPAAIRAGDRNSCRGHIRPGRRRRQVRPAGRSSPPLPTDVRARATPAAVRGGEWARRSGGGRPPSPDRDKPDRPTTAPSRNGWSQRPPRADRLPASSHPTRRRRRAWRECFAPGRPDQLLRRAHQLDHRDHAAARGVADFGELFGRPPYGQAGDVNTGRDRARGHGDASDRRRRDWRCALAALDDSRVRDQIKVNRGIIRGDHDGP